jgi:hypothetical protein
MTQFHVAVKRDHLIKKRWVLFWFILYFQYIGNIVYCVVVEISCAWVFWKTSHAGKLLCVCVWACIYAHYTPRGYWRKFLSGFVTLCSLIPLQGTSMKQRYKGKNLCTKWLCGGQIITCCVSACCIRSDWHLSVQLNSIRQCVPYQSQPFAAKVNSVLSVNFFYDMRTKKYC